MVPEDKSYSIDLETIVQHYDATCATNYRDSIYNDMLGDPHAYREGTLRHAADLILADHMSYPDYSALDVGCGGGVYFHILQHAGHITGIDPSQPMLNLAHETANSEQWPARTALDLHCVDLLNFQTDNRYDLVYSIGVIGHWVALDTTILQKLIDLTASGGLIVLGVDRTSWRDWRCHALRLLLGRVAWVRQQYAGSMHPITLEQVNRLIAGQSDAITMLSMRMYQYRTTRYLGLLLKKRGV